MTINIVSSEVVFSKFKTSNYFKTNLGLVATVDKGGGSRSYNKGDLFSYYYNKNYKTVIYAKGNIGNIKFYIDPYIRDNNFAVYYGDTFEEFIFNFDQSSFNEKGINNYLGGILKESEIKYDELKNKDQIKEIDNKVVGNPNMISMNPGNVSYADVKAYIEQRNKNRANI